MRKIIYGVLIIILVFCSLSYSQNNNQMSLNDLGGRKKWVHLEKYILEQKFFYHPPSDKYQFRNDNVLISYGYRYGERKQIKKKGKWLISIDKGFIYVKIPNLWVNGFTEKKFKSFKVYYDTHNSKHMIVFCVHKHYRETDDIKQSQGGEFFALYE